MRHRLLPENTPYDGVDRDMVLPDPLRELANAMPIHARSPRVTKALDVYRIAVIGGTASLCWLSLGAAAMILLN